MVENHKFNYYRPAPLLQLFLFHHHNIEHLIWGRQLNQYRFINCHWGPCLLNTAKNLAVKWIEFIWPPKRELKRDINWLNSQIHSVINFWIQASGAPTITQKGEKEYRNKIINKSIKVKKIKVKYRSKKEGRNEIWVT